MLVLTLAGTLGVAPSAGVRAAEEEEAPQVRRAQPTIGAENFDRWVFPDEGPSGGWGVRTRTRLTNLAQKKMEEVDHCCGLSEEQKKKLQLAARADISRLFDRVDAARVKFNEGRLNGVAVQTLWKDAQSVSNEVRNFQFGSGSMFRKTLPKALTIDQLVKLRDQLRQQRFERHRANISQVISYLERGMVLEKEQRAKVIDLIEIEVPANATETPYDVTLTVYRVSRIPAEKLKPLLTEDQWRHWDSKLSRFRGQKHQLEKVVVQKETEDDLDSLVPKTTVQTK